MNTLAYKPVKKLKVLDRIKFIAIITDEKSNVAKSISVCEQVGNIMVKGENVYWHFLLFQQCFQKTSFSGSLKLKFVWQRVNLLQYKDNFRCH